MPASRGLPFCGATLIPGASALRCPDGVDVALTDSERRLVVALCASANTVVSRAELSRHLGRAGASPGSRSLDQYMRRLRATLAAHGAKPALLRTVHGKGYALLSA